MSTPKRTKRAKNVNQAARADDAPQSDDMKSPYADFDLWTNKQKPKWHPVKKMRYVFFRMIDGVTVSDALREIRWNASEFWHLIEYEPNAPFRVEYNRARKLQGRALGDTVLMVSEGRDRITKKSVAKMRKIIERGLKRARKQKSTLGMQAIVQSLLNQISENDTRVLGRNRLQIDAAKWLAKTANPSEFSEKTNVALSGPPNPDGSPGNGPINIQFIAPDGSVIMPEGFVSVIAPTDSPSE